MAGARRTDASSLAMEPPPKQDAASPIVRRGPYHAARNDPLGLTARERCVLVLLQQGLSNRAIARRLCRSERTVEHHVTALFAKLGIASRGELASHALASHALESHARNLGTADASPQRLHEVLSRK
jgi:DNA-binding NarL/FixJ family response regulator